MYNDDFRYYREYQFVHWHEIETWNFEELKCAEPKIINNYFNCPRFFEELKFMPGAVEVLDQIKNNYEIIIVSMGEQPNLIGKELWLKENLPYAKFIGCNMSEYEDKSHVDMSDSIFIDDCSKNLLTSNAETKILFGDTYAWNKDWMGTRCFNWYDFKRWIENNE